MADVPHSKREIPFLKPQSQAPSKGRTSRACDQCRRARAKCTAGHPCKICHDMHIECVYSDRKRELNQKLVGKLKEENREISQISQRYGDTLRRLSMNDALSESERTAISNLLDEQDPKQDDRTIMDMNEPSNDEAEGGASLADVWGEARDTGFDSTTNTSKTTPSSQNSRLEHSDLPTPLLGKEKIPKDIHITLQQGQPPSKRQKFGQPPFGPKYAFTGTIPQQPPAMSRLRPKTDVPFPIESWTEVTNSRELIEHLMSLYFCWEYPTFASLSMQYFLKDFYHGRRRYCSPLLVNAVLALGSRFSEIPEARQDPSDPDTAGDLFFEECKRLWSLEEVSSIPTIQAICLMSLKQASRGNDASSWFYARQAMHMAIDMGLHLNQHVHGLPEALLLDVELEVRNATFWGCFNLEQVWCLCMGRLPQLYRDEIRIGKPQIHFEEEQEDWVPYTDNGQPLEYDYQQRSNTRSVYTSLSELSEIIHDTLLVVYLPSVSKKSSKILEAYTRYLDWFQALPDHLRTGQNSTPTVLFTHMYYHFAVILLFRPFLNLTLRGSSISPPQVCLQAAESLTGLIKTYRQLYTLRRTPSFVPIMILTSNLALLTASGIFRRDLGAEIHDDESSSSTRTIKPDDHNWLQFLQELSVPHQFARKSIHILMHFAELWNVPLPQGISSTMLPTAMTPASVSSKGKETSTETETDEEGEDMDEDDARKRGPRTTSPFHPRADLSLPSSIASLFEASTGDVLFSLFPAQGVPFLASTNQRMEEERGLDDEKGESDGKGERGREKRMMSKEGFHEALRSDGFKGGPLDF